MDNDRSEHIGGFYVCLSCDFNTNDYHNFKKHLMSKKHMKLEDPHICLQIIRAVKVKPEPINPPPIKPIRVHNRPGIIHFKTMDINTDCTLSFD